MGKMTLKEGVVFWIRGEDDISQSFGLEQAVAKTLVPDVGNHQVAQFGIGRLEQGVRSPRELNGFEDCTRPMVIACEFRPQARISLPQRARGAGKESSISAGLGEELLAFCIVIGGYEQALNNFVVAKPPECRN